MKHVAGIDRANQGLSSGLGGEISHEVIGIYFYMFICIGVCVYIYIYIHTRTYMHLHDVIRSSGQAPTQVVR